MISVQRFNARRRARLQLQEARSSEERRAEALRSRKRVVIVGLVAVLFVAAASLHAHRVLAAHAPQDMPANSHWILTGRNHLNNDKQGLWVACWKSTIKEVDHCRITNEQGTTQFDGDMLPLAAHQSVVPDKNLQLAAKIDPHTIWVRGVNYDMPVPVLQLANGTQLVPLSDREGLQKRLAHGQWDEGLQPATPAIAEQ